MLSVIILDSSMVEHAAVNRGVVGSSPTRGVRPYGQVVKTSPFHGGNTGSNPVRVIVADMAQLAEQLICNQQVNGSSPFIGFMDGFPSGQRGQTVNLLATPSKVRILLHPLAVPSGAQANLMSTSEE